MQIKNIWPIFRNMQPVWHGRYVGSLQNRGKHAHVHANLTRNKDHWSQLSIYDNNISQSNIYLMFSCFISCFKVASLDFNLLLVGILNARVQAVMSGYTILNTSRSFGIPRGPTSVIFILLSLSGVCNCLTVDLVWHQNIIWCYFTCVVWFSIFLICEMSYKDRSCSPVLLESGLKSFLGAAHNFPLINGKFMLWFFWNISCLFLNFAIVMRCFRAHNIEQTIWIIAAIIWIFGEYFTVIYCFYMTVWCTNLCSIVFSYEKLL